MRFLERAEFGRGKEMPEKDTSLARRGTILIAKKRPSVDLLKEATRVQGNSTFRWKAQVRYYWPHGIN